MNYDVAIIGGGVCGLIAGKEIAKESYDVCIIEEHQDAGIPTHCSALYSIRGLKQVGIRLEDELIANIIRGGRFYSPSGKEIFAYSKQDRAIVAEKKMFDKYLARETARAGAEIKFRTIAKDVEISDEVKVKVEGLHKGLIKSKLLINAEGLRRRIAKKLGFKTFEKFVTACRVEVEKIEVEEDVAEMYLGNKFAHGFYAWILPKGDVYEVGLGTAKGNPWDYLLEFMKNNKKIKGKSMLEVARGFIPTDYPSESVKERVLLVGDVCAQNKATTGGGVVTGGICAKVAGKACVKALSEENFSKDFLKREYEDRWREEIGKELEIHAMLREGFNSLSDEEIDMLFDIAMSENLQDVLIKLPDTDRPSEFLNEIAKNNKLIEKFQRILNIR
ncbi:MAG: hypothetical protein DRN95_06235 [Candidatus Hydrothermarchaeota archaeon]|nr:MAG: hypothetical protein DRN95_06235 [Candidatus Hydrothermarchaeota archaeon]